jgi:hypothetical protein
MTSRRDSRVKRARAKATADITRRVKRSTALHLSLARIYKVLKLLFIYLYFFFLPFFFVLFVFPACNCVFVQYYQKRERERAAQQSLGAVYSVTNLLCKSRDLYLYTTHFLFSSSSSSSSLYILFFRLENISPRSPPFLFFIILL